MADSRYSVVWRWCLLIVASCGQRQPDCPSDSHRDDAQTDRLRTLLQTSPALEPGLAAKARDPAIRVCFLTDGATPTPRLSEATGERGPRASGGALPDGTLLVETRWGEGCRAARMAHLLSHRGVTLLREQPAELGCEAWIDELIQIEARAYDLELRVAHSLGCEPGYGFVREVETTTQDARIPALATFLREHPSGGGGLDAIVDGYQARCHRDGIAPR